MNSFVFPEMKVITPETNLIKFFSNFIGVVPAPVFSNKQCLLQILNFIILYSLHLLIKCEQWIVIIESTWKCLLIAIKIWMHINLIQSVIATRWIGLGNAFLIVKTVIVNICFLPDELAFKYWARKLFN